MSNADIKAYGRVGSVHSLSVWGKLEIINFISKVEVAKGVSPVKIGHDGTSFLIHGDHNAAVGRHSHHHNVLAIFKGESEGFVATINEQNES